MDDAMQVRRVGYAWFQSYGYTVAVCESGVEALEHLRANAGAYDLVMTDYTMPKMAGIELARKIRSRWPNLPVLLGTGSLDTGTTQAAAAARIAEVLHKPYTRKSLARVVRTRLDARV